METELVAVVIRESVSLFVLLLVLIGGFRLLTRLIDVFDGHLGKIEALIAKSVDLLEEYTEQSSD